jgi:hypothetical protein
MMIAVRCCRVSDFLGRGEITPIGEDLRELMGPTKLLSNITHLLAPSFLCYRLDCFAALDAALLQLRSEAAGLAATVDDFIEVGAGNAKLFGERDSTDEAGRGLYFRFYHDSPFLL